MGIFESKIEKLEQSNGNILTLSCSGNLDESTNLPTLDLANIRYLILNVGKIEGVNSIGIRSWIDWMKEVERPGLEIEFVDAQPSFIFQFNMVTGFFPKGASIRSLYIPVYCERCDKQTKTYIDFEKPVKTLNPQSVTREQVRGKHCRDELCELEPDYTLKQYLSFLSR